jgi:hypothetical protein
VFGPNQTLQTSGIDFNLHNGLKGSKLYRSISIQAKYGENEGSRRINPLCRLKSIPRRIPSGKPITCAYLYPRRRQGISRVQCAPPMRPARQGPCPQVGFRAPCAVRRSEPLGSEVREHGIIPEKPKDPEPLIQEALIAAQHRAHENRLEDRSYTMWLAHCIRLIPCRRRGYRYAQVIGLPLGIPQGSRTSDPRGSDRRTAQGARKPT